MKKLILLAFVSVIALGFEMQAQAKIQFKTDTIDYGTIAKGSDGLRVFEFTNTGNQPLVITEVFSSCGCTVPKKPDGPIAPGKSATIEVKYDTSRVGPIRKTITVNSNSDTPIVALKIKGEVTN
ncbi:MAG: hypothetical protein CVT96_06380 [Bacteroidetes bacterium HGW-Bacteroidetes-13]|nr:MAG: hypothetical protein CVT96_06380 [Bacteroidetes bacterium HGW-Bacteroidetes-13]